MSDSGPFSSGPNTRQYRSKNGGFEDKTVEEFLTVNPQSYLLLFNQSTTEILSYTLEA
jgi:hypothetical protein